MPPSIIPLNVSLTYDNNHRPITKWHQDTVSQHSYYFIAGGYDSVTSHRLINQTGYLGIDAIKPVDDNIRTTDNTVKIAGHWPILVLLPYPHHTIRTGIVNCLTEYLPEHKQAATRTITNKIGRHVTHSTCYDPILLTAIQDHLKQQLATCTSTDTRDYTAQHNVQSVYIGSATNWTQLHMLGHQLAIFYQSTQALLSREVELLTQPENNVGKQQVSRQKNDQDIGDIPALLARQNAYQAILKWCTAQHSKYYVTTLPSMGERTSVDNFDTTWWGKMKNDIDHKLDRAYLATEEITIQQEQRTSAHSTAPAMHVAENSSTSPEHPTARISKTVKHLVASIWSSPLWDNTITTPDGTSNASITSLPSSHAGHQYHDPEHIDDQHGGLPSITQDKSIEVWHETITQSLAQLDLLPIKIPFQIYLRYLDELRNQYPDYQSSLESIRTKLSVCFERYTNKSINRHYTKSSIIQQLHQNCQQIITAHSLQVSLSKRIKHALQTLVNLILGRSCHLTEHSTRQWRAWHKRSIFTQKLHAEIEAQFRQVVIQHNSLFPKRC